MAITVALRYGLQPGRAEALIGAVQSSFVEGRDSRLGRQRARLFRRLGEPGVLLDLLEVGDWDSSEAVEAYLRSPRHAEIVAEAEAPPVVRYYTSLRWFEVVLQPVAVAACAIVVAPPPTRDAVEAYLRGEACDATIGARGIRCHQVDRDVSNPSVFLVLHGWAALEDLEGFRREVNPILEATLSELGATVHRFTGAVAADSDLCD